MRAIRKPAWLLALLVFLSTLAGLASAGNNSLNFPGSGTGFVREATGIASPSPLDLSGSFTVEAWINPSAFDTLPILSDSAYVLETFAPAGSPLGISFTLFTTLGGFVVVRSFGLTTGAWNHVAAAYDAAANTCYLATNGFVNPPTPNCIGGASLLTNFDQLFGVGTNHAGNSTGAGAGVLRFSGRISEIRISNIVRYTGSFSPPTSFSPDGSTVGLWHIDEGPGSPSFADSSGGGRTLFPINGLTSVAGGPTGAPVQVSPGILQLLLDD